MELRDEGVGIGMRIAPIHGPAGLDLGGEGPEEIAQAIVAEIVAVKRPRDGGFLQDRRGRSTIVPGRARRLESPRRGRRRCRRRSDRRCGTRQGTTSAVAPRSRASTTRG